MKPAEAMKEKIKNIQFKKPMFDIVINVDAKPENDPDIIKKIN